MFEQDYIMRLIKEMTRACLKLLFNIDTESQMEEMFKDTEEEQTLKNLLDLLDDGKINEAENMIYEMTEAGDRKNLAIAILFYSHLNEKSDEFLEKHNFTREEIKTGLMDIADRYGVSDLAETFLDMEE